MHNEALELPNDTGHHFVDRKPVSKHELNAQLTENALVLPETVGFIAEAVNEEGIWRPYTVEDVSNDSVINHFV